MQSLPFVLRQISLLKKNIQNCIYGGKRQKMKQLYPMVDSFDKITK
jgi:hypothetical protein